MLEDNGHTVGDCNPPLHTTAKARNLGGRRNGEKTAGSARLSHLEAKDRKVPFHFDHERELGRRFVELPVQGKLLLRLDPCCLDAGNGAAPFVDRAYPPAAAMRAQRPECFAAALVTS